MTMCSIFGLLQGVTYSWVGVCQPFSPLTPPWPLSSPPPKAAFTRVLDVVPPLEARRIMDMESREKLSWSSMPWLGKILISYQQEQTVLVLLQFRLPMRMIFMLCMEYPVEGHEHRAEGIPSNIHL